jgi:hypothetical protein
MAKEKSDWKELDHLKEYLLNPGTEKAKDHLVFPLFKKLFGSKFKKESDAVGADIYIEGKLLVELKSDYDDYLKGFYQALHYAKLGLTFSAVCVIVKRFVAVWKVSGIFCNWLNWHIITLRIWRRKDRSLCISYL